MCEKTYISPPLDKYRIYAIIAFHVSTYLYLRVRDNGSEVFWVHNV